MAGAPAALGVAIDLAHPGVDADSHGTDECRLAEVGAEPGPEVVVLVGPAVDDAGMEREPVAKRAEEEDEEEERHQDDHEERAEPDGPERAARLVHLEAARRPGIRRTSDRPATNPHGRRAH